MAHVNAAEALLDVERSWISPVLRELTENHRARNAFPYAFAQKFTIPVGAPTTGDEIVRLFKAPAGAYLWGWRSTPSDMDTDATPALTYSIVATDDDDATQLTLVSASTNGQAAAGSDVLIGAIYGRYIGNMWIAWKTGTAADVPVAGTLKCAWLMSIGIVNRTRRGVFLNDAEA